MAKPHIYTVHVNPSLPEAYENAVFVEEGFSWKAFFFIWLWALYNRLWAAAIGLFLFSGLMIWLFDNGGLTHIGVAIVDIGARILIGFFANDWRRRKLRRQGYIIADIVASDSVVRGQLRFFDRYYSAHPAPAA